MNKVFIKYWKKWKVFAFTEVILAIVVRTAATLILISAILFGLGLEIPSEFMLIMGLLSTLVITIFSPILLMNNHSLVKKLHHEFEELEYSLHLFFKPSLSPIETIQKERIITKLPAIRKIERFYNWRVNTLFFLTALISCLLLYYNPLRELSSINEQEPLSIEEIVSDTLNNQNKKLIDKGDLSVKINPPAYTGINPYMLDEQVRTIEEGSHLEFSIEDSNTKNFIIWNAIDTLNMKGSKRQKLVRANLRSAFSFQPLFVFQDSSWMDSVTVVDIKYDQLPQITIYLAENRLSRDWDELDDLVLPLKLRDDYGISKVNVVATLSSGEGEAVKFRELKWPIAALQKGTKGQDLRYLLKMDTLAMVPGDELYFYVEVFDNKFPKPQRAKSDVYFLTIADTTVSQSSNYEGIALSVEAEYFKSQRQIIIDTEKLLSESINRSSKAFKSRSNLIGDDQKILRLRYGVFLGEEFTTTGGLGEVDHSGHDHGGVSGHSEDESGKHEQQAASESNFSNDIYNSAEMAAYVHAHDDSEIATFFDSKTKQLLKEALANMWEAELYLRTYKPHQALPYEHKALKLIKEVQQASRIYVERIGFEPPPLEPLKKRLSGELSEVNPKKMANEQTLYNSFEEKLISISKRLNAEAGKEISKTKADIISLGQLLAAEIDQNPLYYGKMLSYIAQYNDQPSSMLYEEIAYMLEQILPEVKGNTKAVNTVGLRINEMFNQTEIN